MTDKELYNYFKDRKLSFNEAPGDELWSKIEERMASKKPSKLLILTIVSAAVTGAVWLFLIFNEKHTTVIEQQTDPVEEAINPIVIDESANYVTTQSNDTVKKKKAAKKQNEDNEIKNVEYGIIHPNPVVTKNEAPDEKQEEAIKDSLPGNNKITTSPGKIRIQSLDNLTKEEYDTLVARSVKYYSDQPKSILTIIAQGHKPYRKLIGTALLEQNKPQAFAPVSGYIKFMRLEGDTLKENKPVLKSFVEHGVTEDTLQAKVKGVFKVKSKAKAIHTQDTIRADLDY